VNLAENCILLEGISSLATISEVLKAFEVRIEFVGEKDLVSVKLALEEMEENLKKAELNFIEA